VRNFRAVNEPSNTQYRTQFAIRGYAPHGHMISGALTCKLCEMISIVIDLMGKALLCRAISKVSDRADTQPSFCRIMSTDKIFGRLIIHSQYFIILQFL
jgi:hypothetical protein